MLLVLFGVVDGEGACLLFVFDVDEAFDSFDDHSDATNEEDGAGDEIITLVEDGVDGDDQKGCSAEDED